MNTPGAKSASGGRCIRPKSVQFEEHDGIWWLRGTDLVGVHDLLGLGATNGDVGVDEAMLSVHIEQLQQHGIRVRLWRGSTVREVSRERPKPPLSRTQYRNLMPELVLGAAELDRLGRTVAGKRSPFADLVQRLVCQTPNGQSVLKDIGKLYVYQVDEETYEVDWSLTAIPAVTVKALALIAQRRGQMLPCQVLLPRGRQMSRQSPSRSVPAGPPPMPNGQLRLAL